jgi:hypothetical protein
MLVLQAWKSSTSPILLADHDQFDSALILSAMYQSSWEKGFLLSARKHLLLQNMPSPSSSQEGHQIFSSVNDGKLSTQPISSTLAHFPAEVLYSPLDCLVLVVVSVLCQVFVEPENLHQEQQRCSPSLYQVSPKTTLEAISISSQLQ